MPKDNHKKNYILRKLQEHNQQFSINLPKQLAIVKGWSKGTVLKITMNKKGNFEITELENYK